MNEVIFYFILTILNLVRFKIKFMLTADFYLDQYTFRILNRIMFNKTNMSNAVNIILTKMFHIHFILSSF